MRTHWLNVQREEFKRLGIIGDWDHPYATMDYAAEAQIARELMKFAANGTLYRGSKPVMWSVVEKTALAEAEVEYEDYTSDTVWVKFPVTSPAHGVLASASVVIWTTTPWTLPGNRAISFSPKIAYGLYKVTDAPDDNWARNGDHLILADALAESVFKQARVTAYEKVREIPADTLDAVECAHPLKGVADGYNSPCRCWQAITSPTTPAPVSFTPRPATAARISRSGPRMRASWRAAASTPSSPTPSTRTAPSPTTPRVSRANASSTTRAKRATPTRP